MEQLRYDPQPQTTHLKPSKLQVAPPHVRNLSPQEQKLKLIRRIEELSAANSTLTDKNEILNNTICDLKKVLQFVGRESMQEGRSLRDASNKLKVETSSLEKSLQISHKQGGHLQRCRQYWALFVE